MSRTDKFNSRDKRGRPYSQKRGRDSRAPAEGAAEDHMPSRREKHPSNKQQMTSFFYHLLIVLFIALVIGLLLYGQNQME